MRILLLALAAASLCAKQHLVVISVDGLDDRYLQNADQMRLKIPNLRRLMLEGQFSRGVIGVVPTITWPSHTTLITGVDPVVHGILGNRRPKSEGGDYYWRASLIKTRTLLDWARDAGLKTATVTWPVTVDAPVTWNLPEFFTRRRGGSMDLRSIESKCTPPDLVEKIEAAYPSFGQEWMDDRTRTIATIYLLKNHRPDLLLVHFVDLDSEEHDNAPFSRESNAVLERTDELIGQIMAAIPPASALSVVSDHGFEKVNTLVNLQAIAAKRGISDITAFGGAAIATSEPAAALLRKLSKNPQSGVGREIPREELAQFPSTMPADTVAVFESADGVMFWPLPDGALSGKPPEIGNHGHWPMRYRAVFLLWGPGITQEALPEISMKEIAGRFANVLGLSFPAQVGPIPAELRR